MSTMLVAEDGHAQSGEFVTLIEHHYVHSFERQLSAPGIDGGLALASFGTTWAVWAMIGNYFQRHVMVGSGSAWLVWFGMVWPSRARSDSSR
jgi:hypothetical protein